VAVGDYSSCISADAGATLWSQVAIVSEPNQPVDALGDRDARRQFLSSA
jgi:hypothetical protein